MTEGLVNGFASGFLSRLWLVTWQGTFVALAVWTICRSRSISSRTKCWLWWAVSLRMLIGILPLGGVPLPILPPEPQSTPRMLTIPSHRQPSLRPLYWQVDPVPTSVSTSSEASDGVASPGPSQSMPPAIWLLGMWIAGVLVFSLRIFAQGLAARKLIREATPVQDAPASDLFARLLTEARVRQSVALLEHPAVNGPLLVGVLRPRVLLPTDASTSFSPEELRLALSHEVIHIRRNDLLLSFVPYVARTLFFFHPLAWLAVREHRLALEAACDRDALVLTGGPVSDYGRLLLRLAATADQRRRGQSQTGTRIRSGGRRHDCTIRSRPEVETRTTGSCGGARGSCNYRSNCFAEPDSRIDRVNSHRGCGHRATHGGRRLDDLRTCCRR
jgi:beta-lactamase regulating signal transducer with metallopeptidase domain